MNTFKSPKQTHLMNRAVKIKTISQNFNITFKKRHWFQLVIQNTNSSEFSFGRSINETHLSIWSEAASSYFFQCSPRPQLFPSKWTFSEISCAWIGQLGYERAALAQSCVLLKIFCSKFIESTDIILVFCFFFCFFLFIYFYFFFWVVPNR